VFSLRAFADPGQVDAAVAALEGSEDVHHIVLGGLTTDAGKTLITAEVQAASADEALVALRGAGIAAADLSISRIDFARPPGPAGLVDDAVEDETPLVWTEVIDNAAENVGLRTSYLVYMLAAGIIAAFGVLEHSALLIVGAMAVSPDLLPLSAACVALVGRRWTLLRRALATLAPGLVVVVLAAYALTLGLRLSGYVAAGADIQGGVIGALTTANVATVGVALAAGVAGMLAFETRAMFTVGVAISVTTIPAAAYIGVAAGLGQWHGALGALGVLLTNLALLTVAGTVTLLVQRRLDRDDLERLRREAGAPRD
jgi:uncharacterized hydrophobic protein (TIGR00271 family)